MSKTLGDITEELNEQVLVPAKAEAEIIVSAAMEKAEAIVTEAQAEAAKLRADARADAEKIRQQLDVDMEVAARDFIIMVENRLEEAVMVPVVDLEIRETLDQPEFIERLIEKLMDEFIRSQLRERRLEVLLPEKYQAELETWFLKKFREKCAGSLEVHFTDKITFGFHAGISDQSSYLNFSSGVVEAFTEFLSPRFRKYFFAADGS